MEDVYLFSGLGADQRVFEFLDLNAFKVHPIEWETISEHECMAGYAKRLCSQIKVKNPILIGVSFGGMLAVEVAKCIATKKVILISSARVRNDMPFYYRHAPSKIHKILPIKILKKANFITYWFFGVHKPSERELLKSIIGKTPDDFLCWAIGQIINWKNTTFLDNAVLIQGTSDRILPNNHPDYKIKNGGHLMLINKSAEIDALISTILSKSVVVLQC